MLGAVTQENLHSLSMKVIIDIVVDCLSKAKPMRKTRTIGRSRSWASYRVTYEKVSFLTHEIFLADTRMRR